MSDPDYFAQFFEDVGEGSVFETVLRGHLWVEGELLRSLDAALPFPNRVDLDRLAFNAKVDLVAALGLMREDEGPGFRGLNAIRNRMAHRLDHALTEDDETDLVNVLGRRHQEHLAAVLAKGLPRDFPNRLRYAITAMCVVLQSDRARMQEANARLHASATRLLRVADQAERGASE